MAQGQNGSVTATAAARDYERTTRKLAVVGIAGNCALTAFKLAAGILGNSAAMVSDAIHSLSDVLATAIAYVGTKIAQKAPDESHPYGHDRFECLASVVLGAILLATGFGIGYGGVTALISGSAGATAPGTIALVAAAVSILIKEAMFQYTRHHARRIKSSAFEADAWHHRSDALSSIGALIGIGGARMGYPFMDSVASVVICVFIIKAAYDIFKDAIDKMLDTSCDKDTVKKLRKVIESQDGVLGISKLATRIFGSKIYVDVEIEADGNMRLKDAHDIAENVHDAIEHKFENVKHCMVHVNPKVV